MKENNPLKTIQNQIDTKLKESTWWLQRRQIVAKTDNAEFVATLNSYKIDTELLRQVRMRIDNETANEKLTLKQKEVLSKTLAIEIQQHNYKYYKDLGVPTNIGFDATTRIPGFLQGAQNTIEQRINNN